MAGFRENRALLTATLICCSLLSPLAVHFFFPVIPEIKASFGVSDVAAQFTLSVTLLTIAAASLVLGPMSDRWGRRPVLMGGLAMFLAGAIICAGADTLGWLIVGRTCQAIGAASGLVLARAIGRDVLAADRMIRFLGLLNLAFALGVITLPPVAGYLISGLGWRSTFMVSAVCGAAFLLLVWIALGETRRKAASDVPLTGFLAGYGFLARNARFAGFVLQSGFTNLAFFGHAAAAAVLMRELLGRPAEEFGLYFIVVPGGFWVATLFARRLDHVPPQTMVLIGSSISLVAAAVLAFLLQFVAVTPMTMIFPAVLLGFGHGLSMPNAHAGAINTAPHLAGTASSCCVSADLFFGAIGVLAVGLLADGTTNPLTAAVTAGTALSFCAACVARFGPKGPQSGR